MEKLNNYLGVDMLSIKELEEECQELLKAKEKYLNSPEYLTDTNMYRIGSPYDTEITWLKCEIELRKHFKHVEEDWHGLKVDNKYIISPNHKWKKIGKATWYKYKTIEDLITYYLKNKTDPAIGFLSKKEAYDWMKG